MSPVLLVLFAFLSTGLSVNPRAFQTKALNALQAQSTLSQAIQLQAAPDVACSNWLLSEAGINFTNCQNITNAAPYPNSKNNCTVNSTDYDGFCHQGCYDILMSGYDYIISTGACLDLFEELFAPCTNDTDCASDGSLICNQGNCLTTCKNNDGCNGCMESCVQLSTRNTSVCVNNITIPTPNNQTMGFRGAVYTLKSYCVANTAGDYCSVLSSQLHNISTATCANFASWGCCLGTMLTTDQYCQYRTFNNSNIYQCLNSNTSCAPLPSAQDYCTSNSSTGTGIVSTTSSLIGSIIGNNNGSSGSSGSASSVVIGIPGGSSVVVVVNPNGTLGTGQGSGNGASTENAPWLLVLGLMCSLLFSS